MPPKNASRSWFPPWRRIGKSIAASTRSVTPPIALSSSPPCSSTSSTPRSKTDAPGILSPIPQASACSSDKSQINLAGFTTPITPPAQPPVPIGGTKKEMIVSGFTVSLKTAKALLALAPIPNLDLVPTALLSLIELYAAVKENDSKLAELVESIEVFSKRVLVPISTLTRHDASEELIDRVNQLIEKLEAESQNLHRIESQSGISKTLGTSGIASSIQRIKSLVDQAIHDFNFSSTIKICIDTHVLRVDAALQKLPVAQADFLSVPKDACTGSTRMDIRKEIMSDLSDPSGRYVWLRGSAGLGKTAIAKSIAEQLNEDKRLAASFFFDKSGRTQNTGSSKYFITTLAFQLAEFYPPYRQALFRCLECQKAILSRPVDERQLQDLILTPLGSITDSTSTTVSFPSSVIVLDGLDECGEPVDLESLMIIVNALAKLPPSIKILVSCRPEREVIDAWSELHVVGKVATHDVDKIPEASTHADILEHIQQSLKNIPPRHSVQWPPLLPDTMLFAERCRGHFEVAHIRLRILQTLRGVSPEEAFQGLLQETDMRVCGVDEEYQRILRRAYPPPVSEDGRPLEPYQKKVRMDVRQRYRTVVGALLGLKDYQLSSAGLSLLVKMKKTDVENVLGPISSIINVPDSLWEPITFFHATCPEFLRGFPLETSKETDKVFFFPNGECHHLDVHCLQLLMHNLRPGRLLHMEVYDGKDGGVKGRIVHPLEYASQNWVAHVDQLPDSDIPHELLERFMVDHFLAWLEFLLLDHLLFHTGDRIIAETQVVQNRLASMYTKINARLRAIGETIEPFSLFKISLPHVDSRGEAGPTDAYAHRSALSTQGHIFAMSFLDGRVDVFDSYTGESIWHLGPALSWESGTLSPLVWLQFVQGDSKILGEEETGRIWLIDRTGVLDVTDPLPSPGPQAVAAVSPDGLYAVRTSCQPGGLPWEQQMTLLDVLGGRISSRYLVCPPLSRESEGRILVPRSLGFSPDGACVGAFDGATVHIWSATTADYMECHAIGEKFWALNRLIDRQNFELASNLDLHPAPGPPATTPTLGPLTRITSENDEVTLVSSAQTAGSLFIVQSLKEVLKVSNHECPPILCVFVHPHERLQTSNYPNRNLLGGGQNIRLVKQDGKGTAYAPAILPEIFLPPIMHSGCSDLVGYCAARCDPRFGQNLESSVYMNAGLHADESLYTEVESNDVWPGDS
ncbi:hypothetical protein HWV62_5544 [Athelia sp. TMB]|nr:hypothetical protein HWV62_5544 [Athelia sp. TMB]